MIVDKISSVSLYNGLGERFAKAFDFLMKTDFMQMPAGRYELDGSDIYYMVQEYECRSLEQASVEAHKVYADIQYIVRGREKMGYAPLGTMECIRPYDAEKDIAKYSGKVDFIEFNEGMFAVFFPHDAHEPCVAVKEGETVKKVVVKVKC